MVGPRLKVLRGGFSANEVGSDFKGEGIDCTGFEPKFEPKPSAYTSFYFGFVKGSHSGPPASAFQVLGLRACVK